MGDVAARRQRQRDRRDGLYGQHLVQQSRQRVEPVHASVGPSPSSADTPCARLSPALLLVAREAI